ncbi:hypothetical protein IFVP408_C140089 [Vibrio parahaemolyticus]
MTFNINTYIIIDIINLNVIIKI